MANFEYDKAVFIGRFQPFHNGHLEVLQYAQKLARQVIVIVGSAFVAPTCKNPLKMSDRYSLITPHFRDRDNISHIRDSTESEWVSEIQNLVDQRRHQSVCIVGYEKDDSSYYIRAFDWPFREVPVDHDNILDATWIREQVYTRGVTPDLLNFVPRQTYDLLHYLDSIGSLDNVREEYFYVREYKSAYENLPYPPTHVTADAVVACKGHVLMVKRGDHPGKHQLALPGGFIGQNERIEAAALRKLREETQINVPDQVLEGSIEACQVFDAPSRSLRGRVITHAFLIDLNNSHHLPRVQTTGGEERVTWIPFNDIRRLSYKIFEDHVQIIGAMLKHLQG